MMSMASFWQEVATNNKHISPIWSIPEFRISFYVPDFLHVCDLGISQYLVGNICWDLFKQLHGTRRKHKEATSILGNMALLVAKSIGIQAPFNFLSINMIRSQGKKKPAMRLKAAEGRRFIPVLRQILMVCFIARVLMKLCVSSD